MYKFTLAGNRFQKFLTVLGALSLVLLVVAGSAWLFFAVKKHSLDKHSTAYIQKALPAMVNGWNFDVFKENLDVSVTTNVSEEQLKQLFVQASTLGKVTEFGNCDGGSSINYVPNVGLQDSAVYVCSVKFENGPAAIRFVLLRNGEGAWKIGELNFSSPFLEKKRG